MIKYTMMLILLVGTFSFASVSNAKDEWIKDAANDVNVWNSAPTPGERVEWQGSSNTEATGQGRVIWRISGKETQRAAGDWKGGKLDGYGIWQSAEGDRYEGQWKAGRKHGFGVYTWQNGTRFCGRYDADQRKEGMFYLADGTQSENQASTSKDRQSAFEAETAAIQARRIAGVIRRKTISKTP